MATVDGITAAYAQAIKDASVVSGIVDPNTGHLILTTAGGITIDAGLVIDSSGVVAHASDTSTHGVGVVVGATETQTLTNKTLNSPTLVTPHIASFVNAAHSHNDSNGGGKVYPFSGLRCARSTVQAISDSTPTLVSFSDTPVYDTDGYKTTNSKFTIPVTGKYDIMATIPWDGNAAGRRTLDIRLNGAADMTTGISLNKDVKLAAEAAYHISSATVLGEPLSTGDYISVIAYQNSGVALNLVGNNNNNGSRTYITIRRVG